VALALRDRRRLPGQLMVEGTAQRLAVYRYLERETLRLLGGWMPIIPEWDVKLFTGKHLWEGALSVDGLTRRLVELRAPARGTRIPVAFRTLMERVDGADDTLTRLTGVYRVVKPYLATSYAHLASVTSAVADAPTVDLLTAQGQALERQIRTGESWIQELAGTAEAREKAVRWQLGLERRLATAQATLVGAGGPAGPADRVERFNPDPEPPDPRWVEGRDYVPSCPQAVRDDRFVPLHNVRPDLPDMAAAGELVSRMHRMSSSELGAAELLGRTIYDHPEMPWEFHRDMARQTWDEVRHCEVAWKRLEDLGGRLGMYPEKHGGNYERRMSLDLPHRLAILGPVEEARGNVSFKKFIKESLATGDAETALLYDYVLADETTHVRFTTRWIAWLANHDPATQRRWIEEAKAQSAAWNERQKAETQHLDQATLAAAGYRIDVPTMARQTAAYERAPTAD
jgi:uncharacterized ferritin-like protein (DUF455 family)